MSIGLSSGGNEKKNPYSFTFSDVINMDISTDNILNFTPNGYNGSIVARVSVGAGTVRKNSTGSFANNVVLFPGDILNIKQTSANAWNTTTTSTITIGRLSSTRKLITQPVVANTYIYDSGVQAFPVVPFNTMVLEAWGGGGGGDGSGNAETDGENTTISSVAITTLTARGGKSGNTIGNGIGGTATGGNVSNLPGANGIVTAGGTSPFGGASNQSPGGGGSGASTKKGGGAGAYAKSSYSISEVARDTILSFVIGTGGSPGGGTTPGNFGKNGRVKVTIT